MLWPVIGRNGVPFKFLRTNHYALIPTIVLGVSDLDQAFVDFFYPAFESKFAIVLTLRYALFVLTTSPRCNLQLAPPFQELPGAVHVDVQLTPHLRGSPTFRVHFHNSVFDL